MCIGMFTEEREKINDMTVDNRGNIYLATSSGFVHKFNYKHYKSKKIRTKIIEPTISY